jgi:predicted  nucleic acid-binding Zn-ribbon protein
LDLGSINLGIKIQRILEKIKRAINKGETNKIINDLFDLKSEIEQYTGHKIDINKRIDQVHREAQAKGQQINDKYISQIKFEILFRGQSANSFCTSYETANSFILVQRNNKRGN